jgi:hypothetical protein
MAKSGDDDPPFLGDIVDFEELLEVSRQPARRPPKILRHIKFGAVERILEKMNERDIPPDLDKLKLAAGLDDCGAIYQEAVRRRSDKPTRDQIRRIESIIAAARRLEEQLKSDDLWTQDWEDEWLVREVGNLIVRLNWKIPDLQFLLEWGADQNEVMRSFKDGTYSSNDVWRSQSPFEWVARYSLPKLYTEHFGLQPTFHRRANKPEGPFIRFVHQALIELEILNNGRPYTREYIARVRPSPRKVGKR